MFNIGPTTQLKIIFKSQLIFIDKIDLIKNILCKNKNMKINIR